MLPAANRGVGQNDGFPDTCNTPTPPTTTPIPYPNIALNAQAAPFSAIVSISGVNGMNISTKIPMTMGDEAGVAQPNIKLQGAYTMGNPIVNIESQPAINLTAPATGNNMNCGVGLHDVPSVSTVFFTLKPTTGHPGTGYERQLDAGQLQEMVEALDDGHTEVVQAADLSAGGRYVRVRLFTPAVPTLVFRALRRAGEQLVVLDLRGNPGGDLDAMARLADDFLPPDAIIYRASGPDGREVVRRARRPARYDQPLLILVDEKTASAGELLAGCLQHHRRAVVAGTRTYGKGCAQRLLPDGEGARYTTVAHCRLASGAELEGVGVTPDIAWN
ncbi:MAG: DUF4150 domain-containing protein [Deltaproteobacteria bacterium]|jgi:carboxyl-terminal processing protease|nr:DUF4150 domain-containing protein [Deltaproteobacteria bacterium]